MLTVCANKIAFFINFCTEKFVLRPNDAAYNDAVEFHKIFHRGNA